MGKNSAESIRIENVRKQLRVGKTRGGLDLTPEQTEDLNRQLLDYKTGLKNRIATRVNTHTTAEADRVITGVNTTIASAETSIKRSFVQTFCPEVAADAAPKDKIRALKARHSVERGLIAQLQAEDRSLTAAAKAAPKTRKSSSTAAASSSSTAVSSTAASSTEPLVVAKAKESKPERELCGALCCGYCKASGERKTCKKVRPCRFHTSPDLPTFALQLGADADLGDLDAKDLPAVELLTGADLGDLDVKDEPEMSPVFAHLRVSDGELCERGSMFQHDKDAV